MTHEARGSQCFEPPRSGVPYPQGMAVPAPLGVDTPPRWSRQVWALPVVALLAAFAWWATHPAPLPEPGATATPVAPADVTTYVGLFGAGDRTLVLHSVSLDVNGGTATPHVCRGGSLGVTTRAESFCSAVEPAEGATMHPGDQLVLLVRGHAGGTVDVAAPVVEFREGLQRGQGRTGRAVELTVLP